MDSGSGSTEVTVGQFLKEARSAKGLTIEAVAVSSKVPLYLIRLMEEEQFHLIPDPLYVLRFLSEYSVFLGLDPKQVETRFRRQVHPPRSSAPLQPTASMSSRIKLRRLLLYLVPAAVAAPLILITLFLFSGRLPQPPSSRAPQEVAPHLTQVAQSPLEAPAGGEHQASVKATERPTTAPGGEALQSQPSRYTLRAEAKETTWLGVSVDGAARRQVLLQAGNTAQWSAHKGFVVTIGNAGGIALSLNGKLVSLTGARGGVIQGLALPGKSEPVSGR